MLEPISRTFNAESARSLAAMQADPATEARVAELADKCNQGQMSPAERNEYETYVHVGNLLAILQAKARLYLKQHALS